MTGWKRLSYSPLLRELRESFTPRGNAPEDAAEFFRMWQKPKTLIHSRAVAIKAEDLARKFGVDPVKAGDGGWLHDVSIVWSNPQRLPAAQALGIEVLPEEESVPMILHQKLSVLLAREVFGVRDTEILSAIGCHTTLKSGASTGDKVVFLADKIAWDLDGTPPYLDALSRALDTSLDAACRVYLEWMLASPRLQVRHPWAVAALEELQQR